MKGGRSTPFSYRCRSCSRCCYGKRIPVSPYELARLARARGITTTELVDRHVDAEEPFLAKLDDDSCTFLGPEGCSVHADRPLACRLYPLGRIVSAEGEERFIHLTPHPETEGEYGDGGTIETYLESQDVELFLRASDRLYSALIELSERQTPRDGRWILDVDASIERVCREQDIDPPIRLDERFDLYLDTLTMDPPSMPDQSGL